MDTTISSSTTIRAASRSDTISPTTTRSTRCRMRRTSKRRSRDSLTGQVGIALHGRAALDRRGRRREGRGVVAGGQGEPGHRSDHAADLRHPRCRLSRCLSPIRRSGCAAPRAGANGDRNNTLANFYFGGFGNNYVDSGPVQRYREYYSLPGFEIDQVSGLNFVRQMVEWNLPPVIFESVGMPSFHLAWLRPAIFATALVDGCRQLVAPAELRERRHAGGSAVQRTALLRHDAVGGLRQSASRAASARAPSG